MAALSSPVGIKETSAAQAEAPPFARLMIVLAATLPGKWAFAAAAGMTPPLDAVLAPLTIAIVLASIGALTHRRGLRGTAIAINAVACMLLGLTMAADDMFAAIHLSRHRPYADALLASWDATLGFDWTCYADVFDRSPPLWQASLLAYAFMKPQLPLTVLALAWTGQDRRLCAYLGAMSLSLTACFALVAVFPARGAYAQVGGAAAGFLHSDFITADAMTATLDVLRLERPVGAPTGLGLISFPSFHCICALLGAWALFRTRYLRWPVLLADAAMLAATPVQGSHYLVDLIGGAGIAALALLCVERSMAAADARDEAGRRKSASGREPKREVPSPAGGGRDPLPPAAAGTRGALGQACGA